MADHWEDWVKTFVAKYGNDRLYRICLEKSLNKQEQLQKNENHSNPEEGGECVFQSCHIVLEMSSFQQKVMRYTKK